MHSPTWKLFYIFAKVALSYQKSARNIFIFAATNDYSNDKLLLVKVYKIKRLKYRQTFIIHGPRIFAVFEVNI